MSPPKLPSSVLLALGIAATPACTDSQACLSMLPNFDDTGEDTGEDTDEEARNDAESAPLQAALDRADLPADVLDRLRS